MQVKKALINDCLGVSNVSWKFYIPTISNLAITLPVKFAIFLKVAYFLTVSIVFFVCK